MQIFVNEIVFGLGLAGESRGRKAYRGARHADEHTCAEKQGSFRAENRCRRARSVEARKGVAHCSSGHSSRRNQRGCRVRKGNPRLLLFLFVRIVRQSHTRSIYCGKIREQKNAFD
jgi:hypothetical protein